jgi:hypothetical protein
MPDPAEVPGSSFERPSLEPQPLPDGDRGLAEMLLDSREIPRALPIRLAALIVGLADALRSGEASAKPAAAGTHDRDLSGPHGVRAAGPAGDLSSAGMARNGVSVRTSVIGGRAVATRRSSSEAIKSERCSLG